MEGKDKEPDWKANLLEIEASVFVFQIIYTDGGLL